MISKRRDSPYIPSRTLTWVKSKCQQEQEFVIGGYTDPAGARIRLRGVLLGYYDSRGEFIYAGRVGTGFNEVVLPQFIQKTQSTQPVRIAVHQHSPRRNDRPRPFRQGRTGRTNRIRQLDRRWAASQAAFLGLREDKAAREVKAEMPLASARVDKARE